MFSDFAVAIYFGIGFGGWIYAKMQRRNGGNFKESVIVSVGMGLVGLLFLYSALRIAF